jgi:hypothetical protein
MSVNQYRHNQLRERLRSSGNPIVRDVAVWMTDREARVRIERDPKAAALAAGEALRPALVDEACEVLEPCFRKPLGPMRLRAYLSQVLPSTPADPTTALREKNSRLYGALLQLVAKCEAVHLLTAEDLVFYKKILEDA